MDPDVQSRPRPSIWPTRCHIPPSANEIQPGCRLLKNRNFDHKGQAAVSNIHTHSNNCYGKTAPLLRLSSTGDETVDFSSFEPSNLSGSEPDFRDSRPGFMDNFAKVAFSGIGAGPRHLTTQGLMRESTVDMASQVDLSILMEKFDNQPGKMERQPAFGSDIVGVPAGYTGHSTAGMHGFVKEGVYHPFARNSTHLSQKSVQGNPIQPHPAHAFPISNTHTGRVLQPHDHRHAHPYINRNRFASSQGHNLTMASVQFWQHSVPLSGPVTPENALLGQRGNQPRRCLSSHIRDSVVLRNWIADPSTRSQFIRTEALAACLQHHNAHDTHKFQIQRMGHRANRNSAAQNWTRMTQQNQNPNKAAGCVLVAKTGNSHQAHRQHPSANTKLHVHVTKHSGFDQKQPVIQPVSKSASEEKQQSQISNLAGKVSQETLELPKCQPVKPAGSPDCMSDELRNLDIQVENKQTDAISESKDGTCVNSSHECAHNDSEQSRAHVTSPMDSVQPDIHGHAGHVLPDRSKSGDNEFGSCESTGSMIQSGSDGENHLANSHHTSADDGPGTTSAELPHVRTTHLMPDCNDPQKAEPSHCIESADKGVSMATSSPASSSHCQAETLASQPLEPETEPSLDRKPLHSSLAFLLGGATNEDNDVSDSDWDSLSSSPPTDTWDFLKCCDDPYNPLYGWHCASSGGQRLEGADSKLRPSPGADDELDSGISSLQAQPEDAWEVSPDESDSWDEDDDPSSIPESTSLCPVTKPLQAIDDCPSPSTVLLPSTATDSLLSSEQDLSASDPCTELSKVQLAVLGSPDTTDDSQSATLDDRVQWDAIPSPWQHINKPEKLHPSVLFILGVGEPDSDSECGDDEEDDDFDAWDSCGSDAACAPLEPCADPHNPLHGWRFHLPSTAKLQEVNAAFSRLNPSDDNSARNFPKSLDDSPRPKLKRASTNSCLWIPCDGSGPGRPFQNKKVHFTEESPTVITLESTSDWDECEYTDSRRGPWQEMARDRCRFMDRIHSVDGQIGHVFSPEHRRRVLQRLQTKVA